MKRRTRIVVPARPCQGGMFEKFEEDPYDVELHGIVTADEYRVAIRGINERIRKARPGKVDGALLATGALLVFPLAIWGARRSRQMKKRKKHLLRGIDDFNAANPTLLMRWNRRPKSVLTIERREGDGPTAMAEAQFVGDLVIQAMPPQQQQQMAVPPQQQQSLMAPNAPQHQRMTSPPALSQIPASHAAASSPGIV